MKALLNSLICISFLITCTSCEVVTEYIPKDKICLLQNEQIVSFREDNGLEVDTFRVTAGTGWEVSENERHRTEEGYVHYHRLAPVVDDFYLNRKSTLNIIPRYPRPPKFPII